MRVITFTTLALTASAPAWAQTPDEITPSVEEMCDPFKSFGGAARASCMAYCESEDCDDPRVRASNQACNNHMNKFFALTGETVMPCDEATGACTVDAQDDWLFLEDPGTFGMSLLDNDTSTPEGTQLTVRSIDEVPGITLADASTGALSIVWPEDDATFVRRFSYTACCDAVTCDEAIVTILGS